MPVSQDSLGMSSQDLIQPASMPAWLNRKLIALVAAACAITAFFVLDFHTHFTLASAKQHRDALLSYATDHHAIAAALFVSAYIVQTALSLPGATIMTLTAGFVFGTGLGLIYVNLAATTGACLAFFAARYIFRDRIESRFGKQLESFQREFTNNGFSYLLSLRLIPLVPFFLISLLSGITRVPFKTYLISTSLGIIPGSFVFIFAGRELGQIDRLDDILSPTVLLAFTLLGLFALLPIAYRRFRQRS